MHELGLDSDGRVYFTMKLVKGRDLKAVFDLVFDAKEGWIETRALSVMLKVCEAVAYAHTKGVIHRDLKPANVMVGSFGEVYVMDWGLARVLGRKDTHDIRLKPEFGQSLTSVKTERRDEREEALDSPLVTMDGDVMGTPAYMPPEQARGEIEQLSARSDVYAIGAMLYHLLARRMPFVSPGERITNRTVLARVLDGPPKSIHSIKHDVPGELVAICEKAMSREAADRYADTLALAEDLRAYLEHRVVGAYETGTWAETKKWIERNKPLAAALAAGVLALATGLVVSLSLTKKNSALFVLAEDGRVRAETSERAAKANELTARANEAEARREKANVLRLSAFQTLDDLTHEADALWPAEPRMAPRYRDWLARARALVARVPAFRESLLEIEARALPRTEAEREAERRSHPRLAEWEQKQAQHRWLSCMLGDHAWPLESSVEAELSRESLPASAGALNGVAWALVDPEQPVYGSEVKALLLARRAVALSSATDLAPNRDTLSWALFRLGRLDEALAQERRALEEAGESKREEYEGYLAKLAAAVARWQGDERSERAKERDAAALELAALEAEVCARRAWRFADDDDRWWHAQLEKLVAALDALADEETGAMRGISAERSWGVARRLDFAESIEERSVSGPDARDRWTEAIDAIAHSEKYRDVVWPSGPRLTPQLGLLPIGADPESGLWEFAHLQTGEPAQRGADGKLVLREAIGLVFVLIPGGTFSMGVQRTDPTGRNYDPQATREDVPVRQVWLSPYLLSKFEMTQGQWMRLAGRNPSQHSQSNFTTEWNRAGKGWTALYPVEHVTWTQCMEVMARLGLALPGEAQWENGARAGTTTVYWSGDEALSLREAGNVADAFAKGHGGEDWPVAHESWDDSHTIQAEVGTYRPNAFGLHDVHGNVWEWCLDGYHNDFWRQALGADPVAPSAGASHRTSRGGSYFSSASDARSAIRTPQSPGNQNDFLGLRPARAVSR